MAERVSGLEPTKTIIQKLARALGVVGLAAVLVSCGTERNEQGSVIPTAEIDCKQIDAHTPQIIPFYKEPTKVVIVKEDGGRWTGYFRATEKRVWYSVNRGGQGKPYDEGEKIGEVKGAVTDVSTDGAIGPNVQFVC